MTTTPILDALEEALAIVRGARQGLPSVTAENPVWLKLYHVEQYLNEDFKAEFNAYFAPDPEEEEPKPITVEDLPDLIGTHYPDRPLLKCLLCGNESSAHSGDYFGCFRDHVFKCCDEPMRLMTKAEIFREAKRS